MRDRSFVALFESWRGKYSDNPRAISEHLAVSHPHIQQRWVISDPATATAPRPWVRRNTPAYFWAMARADLFVANDMMPRYPVKRPGTTYVQTGHGTPFKVIGSDHTGPSAPSETYQRRFARDVERWDVLLTASPYASRIVPPAFGYDGPVIEEGRPVNDQLVSKSGEQVRARVRRELGIADDQRVVLYAPTWRDYERGPDGKPAPVLPMDLATVEQGRPDDMVVLLRMHAVVTARQGKLPSCFVDVTNYPEIQELMLAADVLVTDYSATMFDFAVTGRPQLFLAPDLETYVSARGAYLDLETEAPGPVLASTDELVDALRDLDTVTAAFVDRRQAFRERFCPYDDGHATERVVAALDLPDGDGGTAAS